MKRRELVEHLQRHRELPAKPGDALAFVGMYADEPELVDAICEDAMKARERDPLRVASG